jgi:hypothetical protein
LKIKKIIMFRHEEEEEEIFIGKKCLNLPK